jgi:hypothetical protein
MRWLFPTFPWSLRAKPGPWAFFLFFQISVLMHSVLTKGKWSFLGWFLNTLEIVFTLKIQWVDSFSCSNFLFILHKVRFHLKLHRSCWNDVRFNHDQTFKWSLFSLQVMDTITIVFSQICQIGIVSKLGNVVFKFSTLSTFCPWNF